MQITDHGFEIEAMGPGKKFLTSNRLLDALSTTPLVSVSKDFRRSVYVARPASDTDPWYKGLVLSEKLRRTDTELESQTKRIIVRELEDGRSLVDFNFFVCHRDTYRGLYQRYFHSCGLSTFGVLLVKYGRIVRQSVRNERATFHQSKGMTKKKALGKATKEVPHAGDHFRLNRIVHKDDVADLLRQVSEFKKLKVRYATIDQVHRSLFGGGIGHERAFVAESLFESGTSPKDIDIDALASVLIGNEEASVVADVNGSTRTITGQGNPRTFFTARVDSILSESEEIRIDRFFDHSLIAALVKRANEAGTMLSSKAT